MELLRNYKFTKPNPQTEKMKKNSYKFLLWFLAWLCNFWFDLCYFYRG